MKKKVCIITQDPRVRGGIASVINGYRGSSIEKCFNIIYLESYKDGSKLTKLLKAIKSYLLFIKILLIDKPNIVHINSSFGASFYRSIPFIFLSSWCNKPIINHIHGAEFDSFYEDAKKYKKVLVKNIYNKCDILIALSGDWGKKFSQIVPSNRISIVQNYGTPCKEALIQRENDNIHFKILFLGQICKRKGCYNIPNIVSEVVKSVPQTMFILAGSGDIDQIKVLLKKFGVEKNVIFPGWIRGQKKDNLLKASDIFILPSYNEGMPMSILDAMSYGLPIISTNVGSIPMIVHHGINGYVHEPEDIKAIAKSVVKLIKDRELNLQFSRASYDILKNSYSKSKHLELLKKLYDSLGD